MADVKHERARIYAALCAIIVVAIVVRLWHIGQPMRLDEARTFNDYASRSFSEVLSNYRVPNNHIFHTILAWISVRIFGFAEWAVRLPAFIAGVLLIPATYRATRVLGGRPAALMAAGLVAAIPDLILFSTNARGYTLICLAFLALIVLADRILARETRGRWFLFSLVLALGAYTVPTMAYAAGVALWMVIEKWRRDGRQATMAFGARLAIALVVAGAITLALYAPAIMRFGLRSLTGNQFVTPLTWNEFVRTLPTLARWMRETLAVGLSKWIVLALAAAGALSLAVRTPERMKRVTLVAAVGVWFMLVLAATKRIPPGRVLLFLVPFGCMYAGLGFAYAAAWIAARVRTPVMAVTIPGAILVALALSALTVRNRAVFESDDTVRLLDARDVAKFLLADARPNDRVVLYPGTGAHIDYYLYSRARRRLAEFESPDRDGRMLMIISRWSWFPITPDTIEAKRTDVNFARYAPPSLLKTFDATRVYELPLKP